MSEATENWRLSNPPNPITEKNPKKRTKEETGGLFRKTQKNQKRKTQTNYGDSFRRRTDELELGVEILKKEIEAFSKLALEQSQIQNSEPEFAESEADQSKIRQRSRQLGVRRESESKSIGTHTEPRNSQTSLSSHHPNNLEISEDFIHFNPNTMAVMHTPTVKGKATSKKVPTPKPTLVCSVGGCNFTCKYQKYMRDHEFDVHGKEPVKDPMDASVNASSLEDEPTPSKSSEEAKVHDSLDNRPHSTLNMGASSSQDTGPSTDNRRKRGHSSDEDEDEGGDKKKQRDNEVEEEEEDTLSQSPAAIERRRKQAEAKLSLEAFRQKKATEAIMAVLESDSDNSNGSQEGGQANTSVNLLEETVANPAHPLDSLDLTNFDHVDAVEKMEQTVAEDNMQLVRDAQEELARRNKSLEDALADRDTLRTQLALERKSKQVLENKLSRTKKELEDAVEVADGLRVAMADPSGGNSYELKKVRNELQVANNKVIRLTKELDKAKTLRKEALD